MTSTAIGDVASHRAARRRWRTRWLPWGVVTLCLLATLAAVPYAWTQIASAGHRYGEADAPDADVVLVLGAEVAPGGTQPMPFLRGRLDTAAELVRSGRARVILVSGDAQGASGDETAVMSAYLTGLGIDPSLIIVDAAGRDTYDSCRRAIDVYGVRRALVVTQSYHLARAVTLCRRVGIDADGVAARCTGCMRVTLIKNTLRDVLADTKAAWDALRERRPAVESPPDPAVSDALSRS